MTEADVWLKKGAGMTMVGVDPGPGAGGWEHDPSRAEPAWGQQPRPRNQAILVREAAGATLLILAVCLIGFVLWFASLSRLYYDRVQTETYATFRNSLSLATAPTGPTNPANPAQLLASGLAVAVLSIPEIGLTSVVFQGTDGRVLEGGPGHLRDTPLPGQAGISVIFGRRTAYGGPFSRLASLKVGDYFTATTGQGLSTYRVLDLRRAGDPVPPYTAGQGRLILVTADGPPLAPSGVLHVDAQLTSTPKASPTMILSASNLGADEQAMATDPNGLVPVVLWGVVLVGAGGVLAWSSRRWGRWQTWIVAVPVLVFLSLTIADQVARLLPNLM